MESLPRIIGIARGEGERAPGGSIILRPAGLAHEPTSLADQPRFALPCVELNAGVFWETFSYAVIWFCAWVAIALCFR